jgi:hypothetical protein
LARRVKTKAVENEIDEGLHDGLKLLGHFWFVVFCLHNSLYAQKYIHVWYDWKAIDFSFQVAVKILKFTQKLSFV